MGQILEKSDGRVAHEVRDYLIYITRCQANIPTLPFTSDALASRLGEGLAKSGSKGMELVSDFFRGGSFGRAMVEIAHDAVREYPNKEFDVVGHLVHDRFRSVTTFLQQDVPRHELRRSL